MKKYICLICGYIYDESMGVPEEDISPVTKWLDIPSDWICPLCSAPKSDFAEIEANDNLKTRVTPNQGSRASETSALSFAKMSVLCSNLSKGCEKQYRSKESDLFSQLSDYFKTKSSLTKDKGFADLSNLITQDLSMSYTNANSIAKAENDRGALRVLVWSEKVTKMLISILQQYEKKKNALLENKNVYVCEICGFVYMGDFPLELCPVCKVPKMKLAQVKRG